jgi:hypothetical protein
LEVTEVTGSIEGTKKTETNEGLLGFEKESSSFVFVSFVSSFLNPLPSAPPLSRDFRMQGARDQLYRLPNPRPRDDGERLIDEVDAPGLDGGSRR